jgi:hypothetical protein
MDSAQLLNSTGINNFSIVPRSEKVFKEKANSLNHNGNSKRSLEYSNSLPLNDKKPTKESQETTTSTSNKSNNTKSVKKSSGCPCFPWYRKKNTEKLLNTNL